MSNLEAMIADARQRRVEGSLGKVTEMVELFHTTFGWCDEEIGVTWKVDPDIKPIGQVNIPDEGITLLVRYGNEMFRVQYFDKVVGVNLSEMPNGTPEEQQTYARDSLLLCLGVAIDRERERLSRPSRQKVNK